MPETRATAGTPADGYLVPSAPHAFVGDVPDPGARQRCTVPGCGRERAQHVPVPRRPADGRSS